MRNQKYDHTFTCAKKIKDMSNNKQSIHDFDLNIIYEYFANTERQGPGNSQETGATDKPCGDCLGC
jgi:hypothetical protein